MSAILKEKAFPSQYPKDAVMVLRAMSFSEGTKIKIVGSQALRSQKYAGDYDVNELVEGTFPTRQEALEYYAKEFQKIVKRLDSMKNVYISDIKAGLVEEWRVIPKNGAYVFKDAKQKIDSLLESKVITTEEAKTALSVLKPRPKKLDILKARDSIKFHIIRWTPEEVLKGVLTLRDGRKYTLEEALGSPTITKLDVIALIQGRYTELSIIYEFHNGSEVLNPDFIDPERSLRDSIRLLQSEGNLFKVIKRKFSLAKLKNNKKDIEKYNAILNSELGKLYIVYSDVKTLITLLEDIDLPPKKLQRALGGFRQRLRSIYALEDYLKTEETTLSKLDSAMKSKDPLPILREVEEQLSSHLLKATPLYGGELRF